MFHPSQDSSVWFGLTSREQLMSLELHSILSAKKNFVTNFIFYRFTQPLNPLQHPPPPPPRHPLPNSAKLDKSFLSMLPYLEVLSTHNKYL